MSKFTITFVHNRKNKSLGRNDVALVQARFSYKASHRFYSTGFYLRATEWNKKRRKAKTCLNADDINKALVAIEERAKKYFTDSVRLGNGFDLPSLLRHMHRKDTQCFLEYCQDVLDNADLAHNTKKQDKMFLKYLKKYQSGGQLPVDIITGDFVAGFRTFLRKQKPVRRKSQKKLSEAYIDSLLRKFKKYTTPLVKRGKIFPDPFADIKIGKHKSQNIALTQQQVADIWNLDLSNRRHNLDLHRKIFVFRCYTGLAFVDCERLQKKHIQDVDGHLCIVQKRKKTEKKEKPVIIPLYYFGDTAMDILKPFLRSKLPSAKVFPHVSNDRSNKNIKVIAQLAGVADWEKVKTHTARHTFKNLLRRRGASMEEMKQMMGHEDIRVTAGYGTEVSVSDIMQNRKTA